MKFLFEMDSAQVFDQPRGGDQDPIEGVTACPAVIIFQSKCNDETQGVENPIFEQGGFSFISCYQFNFLLLC